MGKTECKAFSTAGISDLARPRTSPYRGFVFGDFPTRISYAAKIRSSAAQQEIDYIVKNVHNPEKI